VRRLDAAFLTGKLSPMNDWPHAPAHRLTEQGAYIVTCGTYHKTHHLRTAQRLTLVRSRLFEYAEEFGWRLQAWSVLSNHYHFVASSPEDPKSLRTMLSKLHTKTAIQLNEWDDAPGRRVWFEYWDSHITYPASYFSRLRYVHQNPVHHGIVANAENYPWCSAAWFARSARPAFVKTISGFKIDRVNVKDDFEPVGIDSAVKSGVKPPHSKNIFLASA
jgi:putative transposase